MSVGGEYGRDRDPRDDMDGWDVNGTLVFGEKSSGSCAPEVDAWIGISALWPWPSRMEPWAFASVGLDSIEDEGCSLAIFVDIPRGIAAMLPRDWNFCC